MRTRLVLALLSALVASPVMAADASQCRKVRMADLGWTDIALTNTTAEVILDALGYDATQTLLGLGVAYSALKENDMDVFLGNWRPVQDEEYKSYFDEGSVEVLGVNLEGAKYTLAVPQYVADQGIKSFDDLASHADKFGRKIYGIEAGSNKPLLDMVAANRHGMGDWQIIESSEAAMLTQVSNSVADKSWVVFLGWEPHPMNLDYKISYLSGGDVEFGPNFGGATVRTIARKGFSAECPNAAKLFANLVFDLDYENHGMRMILGEGKSADEAAREMIKRNPDKLAKWLDGVSTLGGQPAVPAVKSALGL
ncbi:MULTISPECIES: choline ABC transporter substrate-binding protein [Mesorhizobium]|uniref:Glycine/betaine ABC transporter substrate-binding protein n=1 Tax=Rhizobium loti TaxID=381 RepID=A0A6M7TXT7_RHILI|nr:MULTISPECIES: choline ABC transporter substrate-binding protein [Mesorhizobium]KRB21006.1 glycine/betaine ABC transporter substrate-binding protein [Mesorhizobium sp. Root172]OBQ65707.1 glycine/betaine ABC transporter substrate-binding protein [Mesorhizobium loti]QKC68838.1 choline ABC transporter substrate-binding protein [Mesorhizobium loti]QKC88149.1 choline ABC transporter substrate-binding protein [Mesorhizobium sp. NZP2234]